MIQETKTSIIYVGDGVQTSFPFPYRYRDGRDVVGYVEKGGRWERITSNFEYHDGEKRYDYPTTGAPLAKGARLKLARETPRSQEQDFADDRIESAFDKVTMMLQEMGVGVGVGEFGGLIPKGRPFAFLRYSEDATRLEVIDAPDWENHERVVLAAREEVAQDTDEVRRLKERVAELHKTWREKQTQAAQELDRHVELGRTALDARTRHKLDEIEDATQAGLGEIQTAADDAKSALADAQEAAERVVAQGEQVQAAVEKTARDAVGQIALKSEEVSRRLEDAKRETSGLEASVTAAQNAVAEMAQYKDLPAEMAQAKREYDAKVKDVNAKTDAAAASIREKSDEAHAAVAKLSGTAEQVATDRGIAQEAMMKAVDAMTKAKTSETAAQAAATSAAGDAASANSAATKAAQAETTATASAEQAKTAAASAKSDASAAKSDAAQAVSARQKAETLTAAAQAAKTAAEKAASAAGVAAETATAGATRAEAAQTKAKQSEDSAEAWAAQVERRGSAAEQSAEAAKAAAESAGQSRSEARAHSWTAMTQASEASTAQVAATQQASLAKQYADEAKAIAGGDILTQVQADARYLKRTDKIDAYTKAESDNKYAGKSSLVGLATTAYVDAAAAAVVKGAPEALDTLAELAKALGDDPNFAAATAKALGTKADKATVENALLGKANTADVERALAGKADTAALAQKADASAVYTKAQTDGKLSAMQETVTAATADTIRQTTYTKAESDGKYQEKGEYVTKSLFDSKLRGNVSIYPDPSNRYTYIDAPNTSAFYFQKPIHGYLTEKKAEEVYQPKGNYATKDDVYNKTQSNAKYQAKIESVAFGVAMFRNDPMRAVASVTTDYKWLVFDKPIYDKTFNRFVTEVDIENYVTADVVRDKYQPKGNYITQETADHRYQFRGNYINWAQANKNYVRKDSLFSGTELKLPNGATIGVE